MAEETQPFLDALPERAAAQAPTLPGAARAWSLQLPDGERELIVVRSGIGLVAAASALATVLAQVRPSAVVSAGTTGGLGRQVEVGDVCASATLAYTDADATAFGYARGQTPGQPETFAGDAALLERLEQVGQEALRGATASSGSARLRVGQMLAGNSFVTAANVADTREVFPAALSTDMESTALGRTRARAVASALAAATSPMPLRTTMSSCSSPGSWRDQARAAPGRVGAWAAARSGRVSKKG